MSKKLIAKKRKTITKPRIHWFKKVFLLCLLIFSGVLFAYLAHLDHTVRKSFKEKPWSIPAKVYASSLEIYAGHKTTPRQFEDFLIQLNYKQDDVLASEGSYYRQGSQISLKTRRFTFWDNEKASQLLRIKFSKSSIRTILNLSNSEEIPIVRMDPVQIGSFYPTRKEDRILITLDKTPKALIQGLLATEDHDFYSHFGVSFKAIARAAWVNIKAGGAVQGGSTITQQLIKNFYLSPAKSLWRKLNEAMMAVVLEFNYEKDEILQAYLNEIYLGQNGASSVHGFGLASQFYFGRPLENLPLHDIAALVALVRGPSYYDLRRHPKRAMKRRNLVLDEMQKRGYLTEKEALSAQQKKLQVVSRHQGSTNRYPSFLDLVRRELRKEYKDADLTSEGLQIFTTLDTQVQNTLEKTITQKLKQLETKPKSSELETAVVVTRREGGEIVAMAGGRNAKEAGFNRALDALRPIGSLIKPVVYLTALEYPNKYTITTKVDDTNVEIKAAGKAWKPKNYDNRQHGEVDLHTALSQSYNLATVNIGMDVGLARVARTLRDLGVERAVDLYPSLLLGASPLTPLDVTRIYQTLAGDGFSTPLRSIRGVVAMNGERLQSYPYTVRQVVDPAATYITNTILQKVMKEGTGRSAYWYLPKEFNVAGKTGTTNQLRDSWFAGYSGDYLSVAWIGRDDNKPSGLTGASGALQLWSSLMKQISTEPVYLIPPDSIQMHWIDPTNGFLANESCESAIQYPYIQGSEPKQESACMNSVVDQIKTWSDDFFQDNFY